MVFFQSVNYQYHIVDEVYWGGSRLDKLRRIKSEVRNAWELK